MTPNHFTVLLVLTAALFAGSGRVLASDQERRSNTNGGHFSEGKPTESRSSEDSRDGNNGEGQSQATSSPNAAFSGTPSAGASSPGSPLVQPPISATASASQTGFNSLSAVLSGHDVGAISRLPSLDQQQTKQAILQGQAASMSLLLAYLNQNYPGDVLDVKLHPADAGLVYEVRYLSNIVFLHTLYLDAKTLKNK